MKPSTILEVAGFVAIGGPLYVVGAITNVRPLLLGVVAIGGVVAALCWNRARELRAGRH